MRERQAQIISTLSVQPEIDPAKEVEARVAIHMSVGPETRSVFTILCHS
jgi:hypothetical protein